MEIEIIAFDVFGTLVDWRTSIAAELARAGASAGRQADWAALASAWRSRYQPTLARVLLGELEYQPLDVLHRAMLDEVADEHGLDWLSADKRDELVRGWYRLAPWPDTVPGLTALRDRHILATLSNGGIGLLTRLAKSTGMPFDCILSGELVHSYKPDAKVYRLVTDFFGVPPDRVLMVAAHPVDLEHAGRNGMRTAFIPRPAEWGTGGSAPEPPAGVDVVATDLVELAGQL